MNNQNTFYKTFTGADTLAFALFPKCKPILLGSLTTLSYSIYREKRPVPLIGNINTGGFTRGMRNIAGTMIFTLINQHFVKDLVEQIPYLRYHGKVKADELPFFDIMVISANEYGSSAKMMIYGAEIVDDAQVVSVQDMYIENSFGFVARDLDEFTKDSTFISSGLDGHGGYYADTVMPYDFNMSGYRDSLNDTLRISKNKDMMNVQVKLKERGLLSNISGVLDNETSLALSSVQEENKIMQTGLLDETTYDIIMLDNDFEVITIENKNGTFVYKDTNKEEIIGISKYKESFTGNPIDDMYKVNFYGTTGYVKVEDTNKSTKYKYTLFHYSDNNYIHKYLLSEFNSELIGGMLQSDVDLEVKVTATSYYKNDKVQSNSKFYKVNAGESIKCTLSSLPESYIYDIGIGSRPNKVEFFILPQGNNPVKWTIEFID